MQTFPRHRLVIIGLDGLSVTLARTVSASGRLPALAQLAAMAQPMRSELPELSPVNWTSFSTATPPGMHGIYGFTDLDPISGTLIFPDARHVRVPTIFQQLGEAGFFSKVLNLPSLAPPPPCRGILVGGFPAQDLAQAVWPRPFAALLHAQGYRIDARTEAGANDPASLLKDLKGVLMARRKALGLLWDDLSWDLIVVVFTLVDRLGHFLYPALIHPSHLWHAPCMDLMAQLDIALAEILDRFHALPEPKRIMVLADHGFMAAATQVDLNAWLAAQGLLRLARAPQGPWDVGAVLHEDTQAFALDPGRIYIHGRHRFPHGRLSRDDAHALAREIGAALCRMTIAGTPALRAVVPGDALYGPQAVGLVPDLVVLPGPGVELHGKLGGNAVESPSPRPGTHSPEDVFFYDSAGAYADSPTAAGQLVLEHFGLRHAPSPTTPNLSLAYAH